MKLYYMAGCPHSRKVLVCACELRMARRLTIVRVQTSPTRPMAWLSAVNPLGTVPVLELADGQTLYDSAVICDYLAELADDRTVIARGGARRWRALSLQALADGISDSAMAIHREETRPLMLYWRDWVLTHAAKLRQSFDMLEADDAFFDEPVTIGQIAVATSLEWCAFHEINPDFREGWPRLAAWMRAFRERASMRLLPPEAEATVSVLHRRPGAAAGNQEDPERNQGRTQGQPLGDLLAECEDRDWDADKSAYGAEQAEQNRAAGAL